MIKIFFFKTDKQLLLNVLLIFSFIFYLYFNLSFYLEVIFSRVAPIEIDDAYSYMLKGSILSDCLRFDCVGLHDIMEQLNGQSGRIAHRIHHRVVYFYIPFHALLFFIGGELGFEIEQTYNFLQILGSIFILLSVAYFINFFFGKASACLIFLFLGSFLIPGNGIHVITPSTILIGLVLLKWSLIFKKKLKNINIFFISLLMLLIHSSAAIYICITILLILADMFYSKHNVKNKNYKKIKLILSLFFIILVMRIIPGPYFDVLNHDYKLNDYYELLINNYNVLKKLLFSWATRFQINPIISTTIAFLGYCLVFYQNKFLRPFLFIFPIILFSSIFIIFPNWPDLLLTRLWVLAEIMIFGFFSYAIIIIYKFCYHQISSNKLYDKKFLKLLLISLTFYSFLSLTKILQIGLNEKKKFYNRITLRNDYDISSNPLENIGNNALIVYQDEISLLYSFNKGGLLRNAIYLPLLKKNLCDLIKGSNKNLYYAFTNPLAFLRGNLHNYNDFEISTKDFTNSIFLKTEKVFNVYYNNRQNQYIDITDTLENLGDWKKFTIKNDQSKKFKILPAMQIKGIKLKETKDNNWEWGQINLFINKFTVNFESKIKSQFAVDPLFIKDDKLIVYFKINHQNHDTCFVDNLD